MNFVRALVQGISVAGMILMSGQAPAFSSDTEPSPLKAGETFVVQMDSARECKNVKPYEQINLLVKGIDTGIHPIGCDPVGNKLTFELKRNPSAQNAAASNAAWEAMLGSPWKNEPDFIRSLNFTVTQTTASGAETLRSGNLNLSLLSPGRVLIGAMLMIAVWIALLCLGNESGLVRDAGTPGTTLEQRSFSLGRVQMAWWFAIILASYIFLWAATGDIPALSAQALSLMGISGASGLISAGLDKSKPPIPASSGKFFTDLLTDANGVTIYRFQMLVMTVILGFLFIAHVATQLAMPVFDSNTLTLMGISAGTYMGFKVPEEHDSGDAGKTANSTSNSDDPKLGYNPLPDSPPNR